MAIAVLAGTLIGGGGAWRFLNTTDKDGVPVWSDTNENVETLPPLQPASRRPFTMAARNPGVRLSPEIIPFEPGEPP
jgi:hypothetical protein